MRHAIVLPLAAGWLDELSLLVQAGLTPLETLRAATREVPIFVVDTSEQGRQWESRVKLWV